MKYLNYLLCIFYFVINSNIYAQTQSRVLPKSDSVSYYLTRVQKFNEEFDYKKATEYAEKAKNYATRNSRYAEIAEANYILGSVFFNGKDYDKAIRHLDRSVAIANKYDKQIEGLAHFKLGNLYIENADFRQAEYHFDLSEQIFLEQSSSFVQNPNLEATFLRKADLYQKTKRIDEAKKIYNKIIGQNQINKNSIEAYVNLASLVSKDSIRWAINSLRQIETKYPDLEQDTKITLYYSLADLLVKNESPYLANFYLKKYIVASKTDDKKAVLPFTVTSQKTSENSKLITLAQNDKTIQFTKLISIMSIALIAILSLLSLSLYRNNKDRMRANNLLQIKNNELEIEKNKAEKASKARTEFLSTVSHELRTPLNAINGITHILIEDNPRENQLQYLKSLEFSGDYLLRFINDILEINRVESGNIEVEEISYDIRELLENIIESFSELSKKNEVTCLLDIDTKLPPLLIGDPTKLSQIFMNLIGNSMKFAKKGNIWVSLVLKKSNPLTNSVSIYMEVRDSGIGISQEKQKLIFENFTQGSVEINRKYGGTGLGLAIVKSLVKLLGGQINLESSIGVGAKFFFEIEQKISDKAEITPVIVDYDDAVLENKHVLIVEDNKINQMITEKMLSKKKMTFETIENGEESIRIVKDQHFDLILMDIHLPGINGTVAAQEIRKFDNKIPIIALTAISLNENREILLGFGMDEVITKPFQPEKFYETIAITLQKNIKNQHIA